MENDFSFLCDYAEASPDTKLHAVGIGWDTLFAPTVPARHPMMCFVARLKGTAAEAGTKDISIRILDADGGDVIQPIEQQIPFVVQSPALSANANVVVQLGGLELKKYGAYGIHLVVQGHDMAHVGFNVSPPPITT